MSRPFSSFYAGSGMKGNAFLPRGFGDAADRRERVKVAAARRVAPELLAVLREQDAALPPSVMRATHLDWLSEPGTVVVATGQQVGLFLGPLYTIYKAASAIAIARALSAKTGARCVPLFWLQTEDQDFAEIAGCAVPLDGSPPLRLELIEDPAFTRCALADRTLGPEVTALIGDLEPALEGLPAAGEIVDLLRTHYRPGVPPGTAFARVLATLFAEAGLVIFDPRCPAAARLAAPILSKALREAPQIEAALTERGRALCEAGFAEQIELRPGSPLVFFHREGARGPRYRLGAREGCYAILGCEDTITEGELLSILEQEPLRFSTSALLRPILQDTLFPTAVYVGGPAEVNYFAQLAPLYAVFGLELPLVAERAHFRLIPPRVRSLLTKLGLAAADLDQPQDALLRKWVIRSDDGSVPGPEWAAELERRLDGLKAQGSGDPKVSKSVERARASVRHALEALSRRHQRAAVERDTVLTSRLARLAGWLRPEGAPQERVFSFPAFAARVGLAAFIRAIQSAVDPFDPKIREIDL